MDWGEVLKFLVVYLILVIGKKHWYSFIEKRFPDVDWHKDEK